MAEELNPQQAAAQQIAEFNMVKRGESCVSLSFRRNMAGLSLSVKTHPGIETFFRSLSTGEFSDVTGIGRHWIPIGGVPLRIHNLVEQVPTISIEAGRRIRFDRPGQQLLAPSGATSPDGVPLQDVNLSFLRLIGISEGAGVTFTVRGVYSEQAVNQMRDTLAEAAKKFYQTFMKPINLTVSIVTSEW